MKRVETKDPLFYLGVKIPRNVLTKIRKVQQQLQQERPGETVTRTAAVCHILVTGLEALGMEPKNIETKEETA